jgi:hypothetical protein
MKDKLNSFLLKKKLYFNLLLVSLTGLFIILLKFYNYKLPFLLNENIFILFFFFLTVASILNLNQDFDGLESFVFAINRVTIYCTFFCFVFLVLNSFLSIFGFIDINPESARYLLSTLVGSEVTVLALIVTISLVIVQLTIPYTPKINRMYRSPKTNPDFYIILIFYIFSISYGAWVLMQLREGINTTEMVDFPNHLVFSSFQVHILNVFSIAIISFASLVIYIPYTLKVLDPSYIIEILASEITKKNLHSIFNVYNLKSYIKAINEFQDYSAINPISSEFNIFRKTMKLEDELLFVGYIPPEKLDTFIFDEELNPIDPLIELVVYFLDKNEFIFAEKGLRELRYKINKLFKNENETLVNNSLASLKHIFKGFRFGKFLIKEKTEIDKDSEDSLYVAAIIPRLNSRLFTIGKLSIEKKAEKCVEYVLINLYNNGVNLAKLSPKCGGDIESIENIKNIVIMSFENGITYSTYTGLRLLAYFAIFSISRDNKELSLKIMHSLRQINNLALENKVTDLAESIEFSMNNIYQFALAKGSTFAKDIK